MKNFNLPDKFNDQSVSHATMRPQDLIVEFWEFLESDEFPEFKSIREDINTKVKDFTNGNWDMFNHTHFKELTDDDLMDNAEDALRDQLLEWLFDALDEIAPDGYYFGAHIGNGSDYGFWSIKEL